MKGIDMNAVRFLLLQLIFVSGPLAGSTFKLGLENITRDLLVSLKNKRIGLVTNQTGKDQHGHRNVDMLIELELNVTHLFAPEHGIDGIVRAGVSVHDSKDAKTHLPIVSIYKQGGDKNSTGKQVDVALLDHIDVFVFDMQDAGMRHYTYVSTLYKLLEVASQFNKQVIILDRPNPQGNVMEAPLVEPELSSFIGISPIPVRHGMTLGELASYFNAEHFGNKVHLTVVPMVRYKRTDGLQTFLAPLSPNIASIDSLKGYSFLGLLGEVGPFNVGVGTPEAFQILCVPSSLNISPKAFDELRTKLLGQHIKSSWYTYYSDRKKENMVGLRLVIDDPNAVSTVHTLITVLEFFKKQGVALEFKNFDRAMGSPLIREYVQGDCQKKRLMHALKRDTQAFYTKAKPFLLYEPAPHSLL